MVIKKLGPVSISIYKASIRIDVAGGMESIGKKAGRGDGCCRLFRQPLGTTVLNHGFPGLFLGKQGKGSRLFPDGKSSEHFRD